jgi:hypothetical protein
VRTSIVSRTALGLAVVAVLAVITYVTVLRRDEPEPAGALPSPTVVPEPAATSLVPSAGPSSAPASPSVSPSASASASATARPGKTKNPGPRTRGAFPDAGNTGLPAGAKLTGRKAIRVRKAGAVINGADVRGDIYVEADNVTIKNSRIVNDGNWAIVQRPEASGLVVKDSEIRGNGTDRLQYAILNLGGDIKILRNDISAVSDAISTNVGLIEGNYLHDPIYFDGDHTDMIQSNAGPPSGQRLVIRRNTVINTLEQTAAIALFQDFGVQHSALIENNLLAGGSYALYAGAGKMGTSHNIKVINNVFSREVFPKSGQWGPVAYWDSGGSGNLWQGNVWADTGKPVPAA